MAKPTKLKRGDRLVCTHYRDRPVVKFMYYMGEDEQEVWVQGGEEPYRMAWWGPRTWFRKLPK